VKMKSQSGIGHRCVGCGGQVENAGYSTEMAMAAWPAGVAEASAQPSAPTLMPERASETTPTWFENKHFMPTLP
jgi:hypothetical protein